MQVVDFALGVLLLFRFQNLVSLRHGVLRIEIASLNTVSDPGHIFPPTSSAFA